MKKFISISLLSMVLFLGFSNLFMFRPNALDENVHAEKEIPPYAKWGRLAMKETKAKFPTADIIDYLHIGREVQGKSSIEKFKLWLKEGNKEFGVYVNIEFDNKSENVIKISFDR